MKLNQNKKLIALWHEIKKVMAEDQRRQSMMTDEELQEEMETHNILSFLTNRKSIFDRWIKVETEEEGNFMSAMIMDQIMKSIITRLDQFFQLKEDRVQELEKRLEQKLEETERKCDEKMELEKTKCKIEAELITRTAAEMQKLTET